MKGKLFNSKSVGASSAATPPKVEQVLVVPRKNLFNGRPVPNGFNAATTLPTLLKRIRQYARFINRPDAEHNPGLKQIIPYVMITCGAKIFTLHRKATQTEKRLHRKYSIGVGGHINPTRPFGKIPADIIDRGLRRELNEELTVTCPYRYRLIGFLNDDTNDVGAVHFGLVYKLTVLPQYEPAVKVAETELMAGCFMNPPAVAKLYPRMETWSQLLFKACI